MSKKALVLGIDEYPECPLCGCVNDAKNVASLLERNADGSKNFDTICLTNQKSKRKLENAIRTLFQNDDDIALLYFSGHGSRVDESEYICVPNETNGIDKIQLSDVLKIIHKSKCKNKIVILDSCFSGGMGDNPFDGDCASLAKGVTILSASRENESAAESNGHGVFTSLLCGALNGGAADLLGHITPGAVYAYIDKALGSWQQRPVFKTNVQEFISLRETMPPIALKELIAIKEIFSDCDSINLDPSFEFTNNPNERHDYIKPFANEDNVKKMKLLQKFERVGLVEPVDEEHIYFAAMHSKACRLTPLGLYYKSLSKDNRF